MAKDNDVPGDVNQEIDFTKKYSKLCEGHIYIEGGKKLHGCAKASFEIKRMKNKNFIRELYERLSNAADEEFNKIRIDEKAY